MGGPQAQGAAWAGPVCGGAGGEGSFVVLGAREHRCSHPGCHAWGLPGACTHAPAWWVLGWVPTHLGSALASWAHEAGRWVRSPVLPLSPSVPEFGGAAGVITPLLPPKCVPRATGVSWGSSISGGLVTWAGGTAGLPRHPCPPPSRRARGCLQHGSAGGWQGQRGEMAVPLPSL